MIACWLHFWWLKSYDDLVLFLIWVQFLFSGFHRLKLCMQLSYMYSCKHWIKKISILSEMDVLCAYSFCRHTAMSFESDAFENCFITFPSLHHDGDNDDSAGSTYDKDVPVVILLGWAGCQRRHLKKYCAIYEKKWVSRVDVLHIPSFSSIILFLPVRLDSMLLIKIVIFVCLLCN